MLMQSHLSMGVPPSMQLAECIQTNAVIDMNGGELLSDLLERAAAAGGASPEATANLMRPKHYKKQTARVFDKVAVVLEQTNPDGKPATPAAVRALPAACSPPPPALEHLPPTVPRPPKPGSRRPGVAHAGPTVPRTAEEWRHPLHARLRLRRQAP